MSLEEKSEDANNDENPLILEDEPANELSTLKAELEDVKDKLARSMADLDNFKKRIERDREQQILKSKGLAVLSFLEVVELTKVDSNDKKIFAISLVKEIIEESDMNNEPVSYTHLTLPTKRIV